MSARDGQVAAGHGDITPAVTDALWRGAIGRLRRVLTSPQNAMIITFAGLIVIGAVLLRLPVAHARRTVGLLDAFFTATSAVCVTGLTTVDTAQDYSRFGQVVIMLLIQVGGLGVMTFGAVVAQFLHFRVSFTSQAALEDAFFQGPARQRLGLAVRRIVVMTLMIEALGALLVCYGIRSAQPGASGWFEAAFLSVAAFCNAGFAVYSDNLVGFRYAPAVVWPIMALIVLGGLGHTVLLEMLARAWYWVRRRRAGPLLWSLNARIALGVSAALIVGGAAALLATGSIGSEPTFLTKTVQALFQSVTARTAGFNTVDIGAIPLPGLMLLIGLMFIGGSPGSCAGGVKTTTATIWGARVAARLRGQAEVNIGRRRIPRELVRRAGLVMALALLWNAAGVMLLALSEHGGDKSGLEDVIFEQISAFCTVGLSTGLTPHLSVVGKLWIIASMFVGRLGPLTIALAVTPRPAARFEYPEERVMIG